MDEHLNDSKLRTEYKSGSVLTMTPTGCTWTGLARMEYSWGGSTRAQVVPCELILHRNEHGTPVCAELIAGEYGYAEIGLEYAPGARVLTGYDGVMSLPPQLAELLTLEGIALDPYVI